MGNFRTQNHEKNLKICRSTFEKDFFRITLQQITVIM